MIGVDYSHDKMQDVSDKMNHIVDHVVDVAILTIV